MKTRLIGVISALVGLGALSVQATEISGFGSPTLDPALAGGSVETFNGAATGTYTSFTTSNGVTITGTNSAGGPNSFTIDSSFAGNYNTTGQSVSNGPYETDMNNLSQWTFTFASPVSAFGFNWGASDVTWTLSAYDSSNNLIESVAIAPTYASNAGEFYGLADSGISYATLNAGYGGDYVFIDNFTVPGGGSNTVPDGASTLMLLGGAVTALAGLARKLRS